MERLMGEASPRALARTGGALYLAIIVLGAFEEAFVRGRVVVAGDAAATAANLRSMETLWRLGIAAELLLCVGSVALAVVLYVLLRPVGRDLALLATSFTLVATAVEVAYSLQLVEALFPLGKASSLGAFTPAQLEAMVSLALKSHLFGFGIVLFFFGPYFLVTGYLIFRSTYLPRTIGILYQLAGVAYLANGFVLVLAPRFAGPMFTAMVAPAFLGEISFCLWLLVKGVDLEKWRERTAMAA